MASSAANIPTGYSRPSSFKKQNCASQSWTLSKQDAEFINYFKRLCNCNIVKVADTDWPWMKQLMEDFALAGKMKRAVSRQASILELTHSPQSGFANTRFLKGLKMQMSYNHFYRTSDFAGVTNLDYPVKVEVILGHRAPFKKTTLCHELMCMHHAPSTDGSRGSRFIDGVHCLYVGPQIGRTTKPNMGTQFGDTKPILGSPNWFGQGYYAIPNWGVPYLVWSFVQFGDRHIHGPQGGAYLSALSEHRQKRSICGAVFELPCISCISIPSQCGALLGPLLPEDGDNLVQGGRRFASPGCTMGPKDTCRYHAPQYHKPVL